MQNIQILLNVVGVDVNIRDNEEHSALYYASLPPRRIRDKQEYDNLIGVLIDATNDTNIMLFGSDVLRNVIRSHPNISNVKRLLAKGVSPIETDSDIMKTSLDVAIKDDRVEIVKLLLNVGAARDEINFKMLIKALPNIETFKLLLDINIGDIGDINQRDDNGNTILMWAVKMRTPIGKKSSETNTKRRMVVKFLLNANADPNLVNHDEKTAIMIAREARHTNIAKLLLEAGALDTTGVKTLGLWADENENLKLFMFAQQDNFTFFRVLVTEISQDRLELVANKSMTGEKLPYSGMTIREYVNMLARENPVYVRYVDLLLNIPTMNSIFFGMHGSLKSIGYRKRIVPSLFKQYEAN